MEAVFADVLCPLIPMPSVLVSVSFPLQSVIEMTSREETQDLSMGVVLLQTERWQARHSHSLRRHDWRVRDVGGQFESRGDGSDTVSYLLAC